MSKMLWKEVLVILIAVLTLLMMLPVSKETLAVIMVILGLLGIALRFITGEPITITQVKEALERMPDTERDTEKVLDDLEKEADPETPPPKP
jgi:hypothetical protein